MIIDSSHPELMTSVFGIFLDNVRNIFIRITHKLRKRSNCDRWFWLEMSCSATTTFILNNLRPKKQCSL